MKLSVAANEELGNCIAITWDLSNQAIEAVKEGSREQVFKNKKKMNKAEKKFNKAHLNRVKEQKCDPGLTICFSGILYNLEKTQDNVNGCNSRRIESLKKRKNFGKGND